MNPRASTGPRLRQILDRAARLFREQGYEGTSMQDIADACGMTKAGLYHHISTKEALLVAIMEYGLDLFEEAVLAKVEHVADPLERLRQTMASYVALVTQESSKEVTIILHESHTLSGPAMAAINARKKRYVRFLESAFRDAMSRGQIRTVDPTIAAFSLLGTVLWTYKWYRPEHRLSPEALATGMIDLFFRGLLPPPA